MVGVIFLRHDEISIRAPCGERQVSWVVLHLTVISTHALHAESDS